MVEPITARYRYDPDAMADALAAHQRHAIRPIIRLLLYLLVLFYLAATIGVPLLLMASPRSSPELRRNSAVVLIGFAAGWAWLYTGIRSNRFLKWKARRIFRSIPGGAEYVEWSIGPDHLSNRTALSSSTLLWPRFIKIVETPKGFMLYQSVQFLNWIPGHAFASEGELRRFAEMARERVPNYVVAGECRFAGKPEPIDPDAF